MEIGAVKQAFNNELILLKKNLNQAKTQTIHKLTRNAKQFTEKKGPEALKEKFRRKAESAVKEVLIIKKTKARDIGRFIVTHTGKLQDYLNKPIVDLNRACARLLLHKALQEKYKSIRNRFSDIPIKDLFMSRQERLKLKKEEKQKQNEKKKKKGKNNVVNAEGDWDVEDLKINKKKVESENNDDDEENLSDEGSLSGEEESQGSEESTQNFEDSEEEFAGYSKLQVVNESDDDENSVGMDMEVDRQSEVSEEPETGDFEEDNPEEVSDNDKPDDIGKFVKAPSVKKEKKSTKPIDEKSKLQKFIKNPPIEKKNKTKPDKKQKDGNKNKNLNEKILNKRFKKDLDDAPKETKIVDPFFITASGENYLSIAEPRQPDEVKEEHKQGNRKHRRAVMFGLVPKSKPRQEFRQENNRFNKQDIKFNRQNGYEKSDRFEKQNGSQNNYRFNNKADSYRDSKFNRKEMDEESKPEKLHPSWEAKKKQSGILPFQGKKIVFGDI